MDTHFILSVKIVQGNTLKDSWGNNMQINQTDIGLYIDNLPGYQFGFIKEANPGYEWTAHVGQKVSNIRMFDCMGYQWLNKSQGKEDIQF